MKHLDDTEQRLEQAAQEVRRVAKHSAPPPVETPAGRSIAPGWLIFAAAFGVVILAVGVIPLISSPEDGGPAAATTTIGTLMPTTPTLGPETATTITEPGTTVVTTIPGASCSAAGMELPPEQEGLVPLVVGVVDERARLARVDHRRHLWAIPAGLKAVHPSRINVGAEIFVRRQPKFPGALPDGRRYGNCPRRH